MALRLDTPEIFKVLSVESRIRIIELLKTKDSLGVKSIAEVMGITPSAVSQHLKVLKQAGLVKSTRKGYWIPYSIDTEAMENCRLIIDEICRCGCKISCLSACCRTAQAGRFENQKRLNLSSLKNYKRELERELREVKPQIDTGLSHTIFSCLYHYFVCLSAGNNRP